MDAFTTAADRRNTRPFSTDRRPAASPPPVIRGAKSSAPRPRPEVRGKGIQRGEDPAAQRSANLRNPAAPGVFLLVDWIRFVGPAECEQNLRDYLARFTGSPDSEPVKPQHFYRTAELFAGGVRLQTGHAHETATIYVEWTGRALDEIPEPKRHEIIRDLRAIGMHPTRLDIAADFIKQDVGLFDNGLASCEREELCGSRKHRPMYEKLSGLFTGKTLYLGRRGTDSAGKFARLYDKGLETKTMPENEWERLEVEFTGPRACNLADRIAAAEDVHEVMKECLYGAFEFRKVTGRRELDLRPIVDWWQKVVQLVKVAHFRVPRTRATLIRFANWFDRCVAPSMLAMSKAAGMTIDQLVAHIAPEAEAKRVKPGTMLEEWGAYLRDGVSIASDGVDRLCDALAAGVKRPPPEDLSWANFAT